jgi:hypothetical protein
MNVRSASLRSFIVCLSLLSGATAASAHGLHAQAQLDRGKLLIEAKFDGDQPAARARVYRMKEQGERELLGQTDKDGQLRMELPAAGKYTYLVDAGAGHRVQVTFTITSEMAATRPTHVEPVLLSEGSSIEEAGQSRWWKLGIGLVAIFGFALLLKVLVQAKERREGSPRGSARLEDSPRGLGDAPN